MPKSQLTANVAPHSWDIEHWPADVWPHSEGRARYVIRANKDELIAAGCLSRVGREIVVLGAKYTKWLEKQSANVPGYEIAANRQAKAN